MTEGNLLWRSSMVEDRDSDGGCVPPPRKKKQKLENIPATPSMKFKGVVLQQNGHWGAQIYANHQRIWLGTFLSEQEAAMAYDSAAIKLRSANTHRNFPQTYLTAEEPNFQALYTTEDVLNMIKDRSYDAKFATYLRSKSADTAIKMKKLPGNDSNGVLGDGMVYQQLFQKELTPSDVGKLNRLVIPKKHAVKYFPAVSDTAGDDGDDVQLLFLDSSLNPWKFRYCYWKSSQSFVFTRGWNRFVKEKGLRPKDLVSFYKCGSKDGFQQGKVFCMIDVIHHTNQHQCRRHIGIMDGERTSGRVSETNDESKVVVAYREEEGDGLVEAKKVVVSTLETDKKGVRLFGVLIT